WHANVCYTEHGALLLDWASTTIGDRRVDLAYALLSIRSSGATPPAVDFPEEAAYAALLAGANSYQAAQPVDESIQHVSTLRAGWLYDLDFAFGWQTGLSGLERPSYRGPPTRSATGPGPGRSPFFPP